MYCSFKIFFWTLVVLNFANCQIVTVQYFHKSMRGKTFFSYKKGNYIAKEDMIDVILRDYSNLSICCLYLQEIKVEKYFKKYIKRKFLTPEPLLNSITKSQNWPCSKKKSCPSKYKIFVLYIGGITYYEVNGLAFRSLYHAKKYIFEKQNRRVKFGNEYRVSFNKKEPPSYVREAYRTFRQRSRSIA
uniref:KTSC domain-containing protein n=1 Tax=Strongyloides venezuelensis TaxID=75913 RepID=A0A0K0FS60_STRVS